MFVIFALVNIEVRMQSAVVNNMAPLGLTLSYPYQGN